MDSFILMDMYRGVKVFAFGKFYSDPGFFNGWGFSALLEMAGGEFYEEIFCASKLTSAGAIFRVASGGGLTYESHATVASFPFPTVIDWSENRLLECPAMPGFIDRDNDIFSQRCFCFNVDGLEIWLPKLELAGRIFFHYETLIDSAFLPSGLDFNFCIIENDFSVEIHALSKIGVKSWVFESKAYRDHLGWLLTNRDVRVSFDSIWRCLNQEKSIRPGGRYVWDFNFIPPASLSGAYVTAMGCLSQDKKHFLIWEIVKIIMPVAFHKRLVFRHPDLKSPTNIELNYSDCFPSPSRPVDSILFEGGVDTVVLYEGS